MKKAGRDHSARVLNRINSPLAPLYHKGGTIMK